jgi:hypothetical protein
MGGGAFSCAGSFGCMVIPVKDPLSIAHFHSARANDFGATLAVTANSKLGFIIEHSPHEKRQHNHTLPRQFMSLQVTLWKGCLWLAVERFGIELLFLLGIELCFNPCL